MKRSTVEILASYVDSLHPIIYINHFDFHVIDEAIARVGEHAHCIEFNNALGLVDFKTKSPEMECSLEKFLELTMDDGFSNETFLILKDVHDQLKDPKIIALLKRIAENNLYIEDYSATVFIVSEVTVIPRELENYITLFDVPLPSSEEIYSLIHEFVKEQEITVDEDTANELALSFKGLNEFQIRQILNLAYQDGGCIDKDDEELILKGKEQFIKKSGMLEIVSFSERPEDIGGLENLKDWLHRKARVFANLDKAIRFGVDVPKGLLIVGMPGCGKSLTAKATASFFHLPLVRLDIGRLLGKYVGDSESNLRRALKLAEAISPCVLWIDEIEKAFAGVGSGGGGNEVTTRLFGQFLTWMQEKESTVFIVATANSMELPPEFWRRGRFDERFFVDLPNEQEREQILNIHLKKRGKWNRDINTAEVAKQMAEYCGADIEAVVQGTVEAAFLEGRETIRTEDLQKVRQKIKIADQTKNREKLLAKVDEHGMIDASRDTAKEASPAALHQTQEASVRFDESLGAADWMTQYAPKDDPQSAVRLIAKALGIPLPRAFSKEAVEKMKAATQTADTTSINLNRKFRELKNDPRLKNDPWLSF